MPMPNTGFPRIAIYGAKIAHMDDEKIIFLDKNNNHLLTLSLLGNYESFQIYHHESPRRPSSFATEPLSPRNEDDEEIPF